MPSAKKDKITPLPRETYLAMIENSEGCRLFRDLYAKVGGKKQNVTGGGGLSCAFFVSSITTLAGLSEGIHGTVDGTARDLVKSGWREIRRPRLGAIVVWEEKAGSGGEKHKHIGFYVGQGQAISNSSRAKAPRRHHWQFGGKRKATNIFWNGKLGR